VADAINQTKRDAGVEHAKVTHFARVAGNNAAAEKGVSMEALKDKAWAATDAYRRHYMKSDDPKQVKGSAGCVVALVSFSDDSNSLAV